MHSKLSPPRASRSRAWYRLWRVSEVEAAMAPWRTHTFLLHRADLRQGRKTQPFQLVYRRAMRHLFRRVLTEHLADLTF